MVYTIFLGKQGKRVYTIGPEGRVYTIEPQTQKKKKRRVSTVVVYTFFFLAHVDISAPNKKYLAPNSLQTPSRPPSPPPTLLETPFGIFNKTTDPPPPYPPGLPFPLPRAEKK